MHSHAFGPLFAVYQNKAKASKQAFHAGFWSMHRVCINHTSVKFVTRGFSCERTEESGQPAVISILFSFVI